MTFSSRRKPPNYTSKGIATSDGDSCRHPRRFLQHARRGTAGTATAQNYTATPVITTGPTPPPAYLPTSAKHGDDWRQAESVGLQSS